MTAQQPYGGLPTDTWRHLYGTDPVTQWLCEMLDGTWKASELVERGFSPSEAHLCLRWFSFMEHDGQMWKAAAVQRTGFVFDTEDDA